VQKTNTRETDKHTDRCQQQILVSHSIANELLKLVELPTHLYSTPVKNVTLFTNASHVPHNCKIQYDRWCSAALFYLIQMARPESSII